MLMQATFLKNLVQLKILSSLTGVYFLFFISNYSYGQTVQIERQKDDSKYEYSIDKIPFKGELSNFRGVRILQDREGFMWFGSEEGLYSYDGSGYKIYRNNPDDPNSISHSKIQALLEDRDGVMWVGTYAGLNKYDKYTGKFKRYSYIWGDSTSIGNHRIDYIFEDKKGYLWIATYSGFSRFDSKNEVFKNFSIKRKLSSSIKEDVRVYYLDVGSDGFLQLMTEEGFYKMDIQTETIFKVNDTSDPAKRLFSEYLKKYGSNSELQYLRDEDVIKTKEDKLGNFWIRTREGLYCYSKNLECIFNLKHEKRYPENPEYDFAYELLEDNTGAIWFFTMDGIYQIIRRRKNFRVYDPDPLQQSYIECFYIEDQNHIWLGTLRGIFRLDRSTDSLSLFYGDLSFGVGQPHSICEMFRDSRNKLWLPTNHEALICVNLEEGPEKPFVKYVKVFPDTTKDSYDFRKITNIFEDSSGKIWFGHNENPALFYDPEEGRFIRLVDNPDLKHPLPDAPQITLEAEDGTLYAVNYYSLYKIVPPFIKVSEFEVMPSDVVRIQVIEEDGITHDLIDISILSYLDSKGVIWLGTSNRGLYRLTPSSEIEDKGSKFIIKTFTTNNGLPSNQITSLQEDGIGNLWMGTWEGLSRFNLQSETFTNYFMRHGLKSNVFRPNSVYRNTDGEMYFGTRDGLISFYPDSLEVNDFDSPVRLTDFKINNLSISQGEKSVLQKSIAYTDKIELKYNQNHLSFEFAILNYIEPDLNQYKYILEGFDQNWIYSKSRNYAVYSNLAPGKYKFRATGSNNNGIWNEEGASVDIVIYPPPWNTWYAYLLYLGLSILIFIWIWNYLMNRSKMRTAVEIERIEKEKILEMDQIKSRFFTNISHEFRTPLTLLIGPLEDSAKQKAREISLDMRIIRIMLRNARRLHRLINQLLDISKIESGKMQLRLVKGDLAELVRVITGSFLSLAETHKINYQVEVANLGRDLCFDPDKLEKVINNLLSNAFKFTPEGGEVKLTMKVGPRIKEEEGIYAVLKVTDTGKGIPKEQMEHIFDRFFQVSDSDTREVEGSGIGLALTKELVELMHGSIQVESSQGQGTGFTVKFPVSEECFTEQELADHETGVEIERPDTREEEETLEEFTAIEEVSTRELILVVEDNSDLRKYIKDQFREEYEIIDAKNGQTGYEKAIEHIPDIIITDLMMPVMGGMELCQKVKNHPDTNHIPVILLTAKADKESKLGGLEADADDYIIKPFDSEVLVVRVKNLLRQRKKLREYFEKSFLLDSNSNTEDTIPFSMLKQILEVIKRNLSDSDFNVNKLGDELHMSRSNVFRKITSVAGTTPNELLRMVRMKEAARLLRKNELNITQIMYQVGLKNLSHFAQTFKKFYGVNPSEYR